jgi:deoxyribodipyrimidine photolyase
MRCMAHAATHSPVLCLYVLEPCLWAKPDSALQHYQLLRESLRDLAQQLRGCGELLQLARIHPQSVVAVRHPGTVDSTQSASFCCKKTGCLHATLRTSS